MSSKLRKATWAFALLSSAAFAQDPAPLDVFGKTLDEAITKAPDGSPLRAWRNALKAAFGELARSDACSDGGKVCADAADKLLKSGPPKPDDRLMADQVLEALEGAQVKLNKLRSEIGTVYKNGDEAIRLAAALERKTDVFRSGTDRGRLARSLAKVAQEEPLQLKAWLSRAQIATNDMAQAAKSWRSCPGGDDSACRTPAELRGLLAMHVFNGAYDKAKEIDTQLGNASMGLAALLANPTAMPEEVDDAVAFRRLLDKDPDLRSFFGGDAVGITAARDDAAISFRLVKDLDGSLIGRRNRVSLIVTTPLNKNGVSRVIDSADPFANLTQVKMVWQLTNKPFKLIGKGVLNDFAVGVSAAQKERSYFTQDTSDPTKASETKRSYVEPGISARWTVLANPTEGYRTLLTFGLNNARTYKDGTVETRCPVNPAAAAPGLNTCFTGSWDEPQRKTNRVLSMEWRQQFPFLDMGFKLTDNRTTGKRDYEIPFYLVKALPAGEGEKSVSAGVVLSRSTGTPGIRWGLFLSTPLSFTASR